MTRPEAIEIARKLKALAEKAIDHEKANATQKLKAFCSKHGLDEDEYSTDLIRVSISYKNAEEKNLLSHVVCMVMESDNVRGTDKSGSFSFQCTPYQFELIKDAYAYYRNVYREYCEAILIAMITKNEIVNTKKSDKPFQMEEMTEEERKEWDETLKKMAPAPDEPKDPAAGDTAKSDGVPPPQRPPAPPTDESKRNERISRILFVMEPNKWEKPKPRAKLFLG